MSSCLDHHESCTGWGEQGECDANPAFMLVNCPRTCDSCPPTNPSECVDRHKSCFLGAILGECQSNPSYYLSICSYSCRAFLPDVCGPGKSSVQSLCNDNSFVCGIKRSSTAAVGTRSKRSYNLTSIDSNKSLKQQQNVLSKPNMENYASKKENYIPNILFENTEHQNIDSLTEKISSDGQENTVKYKALVNNDTNNDNKIDKNSELKKTPNYTNEEHVSPTLSNKVKYEKLTNYQQTSYSSSIKAMNSMDASLSDEMTFDKIMLQEKYYLFNTIFTDEAESELMREFTRQKRHAKDEMVSEGMTLDEMMLKEKDYLLNTMFTDEDESESMRGFTQQMINTLDETLSDDMTLDGMMLQERDNLVKSMFTDKHEYEFMREFIGQKKHTMEDTIPDDMRLDEIDYLLNTLFTDENESEFMKRLTGQERQTTNTSILTSLCTISLTNDVFNNLNFTLLPINQINICNLALTVVIPIIGAVLAFLGQSQQQTQTQLQQQQQRQQLQQIQQLQNQQTEQQQLQQVQELQQQRLVSLQQQQIQQLQQEQSQFIQVQQQLQQQISQQQQLISQQQQQLQLQEGQVQAAQQQVLEALQVQQGLQQQKEISSGELSSISDLHISSSSSSSSSLSSSSSSSSSSLLASSTLSAGSASASSSSTSSSSQSSSSQSSSDSGNVVGSALSPLISAGQQTLVPYCDASGYSNLVRHLQVLTGQNSGRPLSQEARGLAMTINYCQYGVGTRDSLSGVDSESSHGLFLEGPLNTIEPPQRWPGLSFTDLEFFQQDPVPTSEVISIPDAGYMNVGFPDFVSDNGTGNNSLSDTSTSEAGISDEGNADAGSSDDDNDVVKADNDSPRPVTVNSQGRSAFSCGGSPISPYHILTAAHCVIADDRLPQVVRLGEVDFDRLDEGQAYDFDIVEIHIHPEYKLPQKYNDIAIITLKQKIEVDIEIVPYCLPLEQLDLRDGTRCTVSGWGVDGANDEESRILHEIEVEVVDKVQCEESYTMLEELQPLFSFQYPRGIADSTLCAGRINSVCRGDSGGPLILTTGEDQQTEVGVVSTGFGCFDTRFPGIYTRVDQYLPWIDQITKGTCGN